MDSVGLSRCRQPMTIQSDRSSVPSSNGNGSGSRTKQEGNVMFTAALTRKTLQALCLSVWMCCLPALKAGIDCAECAEFCSSPACCPSACTSCESGARDDSLPAISLSRTSHSAVPPGEPCSCSCCVLRIDTAATANSSPRGRSVLPSVEHTSTSVSGVVGESAPSFRSADCDRRSSVRSLENCVRLCRFRL